MSDAVEEGTDGMELEQFTDENEDIEDDEPETSPLIVVAAPESSSNFTIEIPEIFVPGENEKYIVSQPQVLSELKRQSDMDETDYEYLTTEEQEPRILVSHPSETEKMVEGTYVPTTGGCCFPSKSDHLQKKYNELSFAVKYYQKEKIEKILNDAEPSTLVKLLTLPDENGRPCIMQAVSRQSLNCIRPLLEKFTTLDSHFDSFGIKRIQALRSQSDKKNILHVAAKMVQLDKEILNAITNIDLIMKELANSKDSNGTTPLIVACQCRNHVVAQILVNARAKIDHVDRSKKNSPVSPIYLAAANGSHETLKLFLKHGARDTTNQLDLFKRRELYGNKGTILQAILESQSPETLQVCLDNGRDDIINCLRAELYSKSTKSSSQKSFIHAVCETPLVSLLELAIEDNKQVLENLDEDNMTPLMKATEAKQFEIVKLILSKESGKKTLSWVKKETGETALMLACKKGVHLIVKFIMENFASEIDLSQKDQVDRNVFHHVAKHDDTFSVMIDICKHKEEYKNYKDYLILKDKDGYVPLHNAAASGAYKSVELLLENGAPYDTKSNTSRTALHYAAFSNIETIKVLLDFVKRTTNNQDAVQQFIDEVDFRRQTSLHLAASFGKWQTVSVLLENGATIKCDEENETALFLASHTGCTKTVQLLIENNPAIVNIENLAGQTAAMFAALNDQTKVLEMLLDNDAKLWADSHGTGDEMGRTCLDWAVLNKNRDTVKTLLERPDWREIMGKSCFSPDGLLAEMVKCMPNLAIEVLNKCEEKGEKTIKYDFFALQTKGATKCGNGKRYVSAMKALETMAENSRIDCLNHVVVRKFLDKKWSLRARKWYLSCLVIYAIFLLSFTSYISLFTENYPSDAPYMIISNVICWVFFSLSVIKELFKLFHQKSEYFSISTCLELIMYICVFIFLPYDKKSNRQLHAGAIAIFLGWINFTWFLKRFPTYGIYIIMAKKIFFTFLKVFLPVSFFMMAFSMTFFVLLHKEVTMSTNTTTHIMTPEENEGFGNIFQSFVTSFAMMVGEVEYRDVFLQQTGENFALIQVFLVIFLVLMSILLMNLLTGLAVGDIDVIMKRSLAEKRIQRAMLIVDLDKHLNKYCVLGLEAEYVEPLEIPTQAKTSHGNFGINKGDRKSGVMSYLRKLSDKMFPSLDLEEEKSQECEITRMKEQLNAIQATLDEMNKRLLSENQVQKKRELRRPRRCSYVDGGNLSGMETKL